MLHVVQFTSWPFLFSYKESDIISLKKKKKTTEMFSQVRSVKKKYLTPYCEQSYSKMTHFHSQSVSHSFFFLFTLLLLFLFDSLCHSLFRRSLTLVFVYRYSGFLWRPFHMQYISYWWNQWFVIKTFSKGKITLLVQ